MAKGHDRKGRDFYTDRYTRLYTYMLKSPAWNSLDPFEKCTLIAIKRRYNGFNNGAISMSIREICDEVGCGNMKAQKSIKILKERGFIKAEQTGSFHWKTRHDGTKAPRATTWILTDESQDLPLKVLGGATKEFMKWRPDDDPDRSKKKKTTVITEITNDNPKNYHKNKMVITEITNSNPKNYQDDSIVCFDGNHEEYTYNIPYTPLKITNGMGG